MRSARFAGAHKWSLVALTVATLFASSAVMYSYSGLPKGEYTLCVALQGRVGLSRLATIKEGRLTISDFDLKYFETGK